jgi:LysM repeat protein
MQNLTATLVALGFMATLNVVQAQTLTGSRASMQHQHQQAIDHGYTFVKTSRVVTNLVDAGELVKVPSSRHLALHNVSFAYLRPQVKTLLERLGAQYYAACGEQLTVTSMTRPMDRQPANAAADSVHPTGMAFDLRIPQRQNCRAWLERTLLSLEAQGVLDATRERNPPHYHIAVFPQQYEVYLASLTGSQREYVVRRGDTLSSIASATGSTVPQLRATNGLRGDLINIGQKLTIPASGRTVASNSSSATSTATSGTPVAMTVSMTTDIPQRQEVSMREVTHQVKRGETLWRIANRYRTSVDALRLENGLADDLLRVGQVLRISLEES